MKPFSRSQVLSRISEFCSLLDSLYSITCYTQNPEVEKSYSEYVTAITCESSLIIKYDDSGHHSILRSPYTVDMRRFKALSSDGNWVYGWPFPSSNLAGDGKITDDVSMYVSTQNEHGPYRIDNIISDTICESFGKYDNSHNLIYTGDILRIQFDDPDTKQKQISLFVAYFDKGNSEYCIGNIEETMSIANIESCDIIGNIYTCDTILAAEYRDIIRRYTNGTC